MRKSSQRNRKSRSDPRDAARYDSADARAPRPRTTARRPRSQADQRPAHRSRLQSRLDRHPDRARLGSPRLAGDWTLAALFGPQHGFRSDLQENMIESPHAQDARRRVPVHSLYSETREPTAEMLADIDVLVIDLQDVGTRIYTYIYTMANCLRAARRHGIRVVVCDRPNPIDGDDIEGATLDPGVCVVRRSVPDPDAARPDDRRAGAPLQRPLRPRGRRRRRPDGRLDARDVLRRDRAAVGAAVAEHSDARHRDRLSGRGAVRGHAPVGGARHDAAVRAHRRARGSTAIGSRTR